MNRTNRRAALPDVPSNGRHSRRDVLRLAAAIGAGQSLAWSPLGVASQSSSPRDLVPSEIAPDAGTAGQRRGAGEELRIRQWLTPTTLSAHTTRRARNLVPIALVTEPLLHFLPDGTPVPCLVDEVPSHANGLLANDLTAVTYRLRDGIVWSDGTPLTANDVVFTWQWIRDPFNQSPDVSRYEPIDTVTAIDDRTIEITFTSPRPDWFTMFASGYGGGIYPEHVLAAGSGAHDAFVRQPIGTGPYVVESLTVDDHVVIVFTANERYREPNKPFFDRIVLDGGGDGVSTARAVFDTGSADFAPFLYDVPPDELRAIAAGERGDLIIAPGTTVEYLTLNFSDPRTTVDGQRSHWRTPNPVLSDKSVRQALALGVDRAAIAESLFSGPPGEPPTANILTGIPAYESPNTSWAFDVERGRQLLEEAGWILDDGDVRTKDGIELALTYVIPNDPLRQESRAIVVQGWQAMGVRVETREVKPDIFYDQTAGNEWSHTHMYYADVHQYAAGPLVPFPLAFMRRWMSDGGENIAQKENLWSKPNESRYHNPDYDALCDAAAVESDPARLTELFVAMNDALIDDAAVIPLVQWAAETIAIAKTLRRENLAVGFFEPSTWNIANWNRVETDA